MLNNVKEKKKYGKEFAYCNKKGYEKKSYGRNKKMMKIKKGKRLMSLKIYIS